MNLRAKMLESAKANIEDPNRFMQGAYYGMANGKPCPAIERERACRWCAH